MFTCVDTKTLCCIVDKNEAKKATSLSPLPKDDSKPSPKVEDLFLIQITFFDDDLLLCETLHNCNLFMVGFACDKRVIRILVDEGLKLTSF